MYFILSCDVIFWIVLVILRVWLWFFIVYGFVIRDSGRLFEKVMLLRDIFVLGCMWFVILGFLVVVKIYMSWDWVRVVFIKDVKSGCGLNGLDFSLGWNWMLKN